MNMTRKVLWHLLLIFLRCSFSSIPHLHLSLSHKFPVLKVYVFEVAGTAISVVAVPGAAQMWQTGASVMLSLARKRNLQSKHR